MSLKMIVTMKQVPDTQQITGEAMKPDGTVNREVLPAIINPEDLNALEEALKLKDKFGGNITVISMGPPYTAEALKECYYRGADDVILISCRNFAGADTLATSYTLKCAIEKIGAFDIIFSGRQAIDGDTAQVGPQLAEKLKINQITCVSEIIDIKEGKNGYVKVKRNTEYGYEILKTQFPILLTITNTANEPRSPSAKRLLAFKNMIFRTDDMSDEETGLNPKYIKESQHFKMWNSEILKIECTLCGQAGSPTKVKKIESVVLTANDIKQIPSNDEGISSLMHELRQDHIIG